MTTDRPILMSALMVRALLDGRKTQTRRMAWRKNPINLNKPIPKNWRHAGPGFLETPTIWQSVKPGDRIYVRETWVHGLQELGQEPAYYRADGEDECTTWRPSIHMPRRFSRLTLVVTATKVERVQEISFEDMRDEGTICPIHGTTRHVSCSGLRRGWEDLWQSLHPKPPNRWEDNPEVVALTFTVHQRNIDAMEKVA